jgi:lysophospholipase L1-like esterase
MLATCRGPILNSSRFDKRVVVACLALLVAGWLATAFALQTYIDKKLRRLAPPYPSVFRDKSPQADIILFGDSRAANWNIDELSNLGVTINAGIRGDVTISMLNRLGTDVLAMQPKFVILVAGINDVVTGSLLSEQDRKKNLEDTKRNLDQIVNSILKSNAHIILLTISPPLKSGPLRRLVWGDNIIDDVQTLNRHIYLYGKLDRVVLIDVVAEFSKSEEDWVRALRRDALHYNQRAYDILDRAVFGAILSHGDT